jgi:hypothetical protein
MSGVTGYRGLSFEAFWALPEYFPSYVSIRCRFKGLLGDCRRTGAHLTISADVAALEIGMPGPFRKQEHGIAQSFFRGRGKLHRIKALCGGKRILAPV